MPDFDWWEPSVTEPFGTESNPEYAEPASVPEVADEQLVEHPPPTVPDNQPSWLKDVFTYFHNRLSDLEKRLPH